MSGRVKWSNEDIMFALEHAEPSARQLEYARLRLEGNSMAQVLKFSCFRMAKSVITKRMSSTMVIMAWFVKCGTTISLHENKAFKCTINAGIDEDLNIMSNRLKTNKVENQPRSGEIRLMYRPSSL